MKENKSTKKKVQISKEDEEKMLILSRADEVKGEQLTIGSTGIQTENELKRFALGSDDNPEKKYDLYYKGIMKLLRKFLPKGKENYKARHFIYEEKNTMLTRGKRIKDNGRRGADSRMAYNTDIEEVLNIITQWVASKGTMIELYTTLRDMNIAKGYGKPKH